MLPFLLERDDIYAVMKEATATLCPSRAISWVCHAAAHEATASATSSRQGTVQERVGTKSSNIIERLLSRIRLPSTSCQVQRELEEHPQHVTAAESGRSLA